MRLRSILIRQRGFKAALLWSHRRGHGPACVVASRFLANCISHVAPNIDTENALCRATALDCLPFRLEYYLGHQPFPYLTSPVYALRQRVLPTAPCCHRTSPE